MKILGALVGIFFLFSCEKAISFKPRNSGSVVVVEAYIENDKSPIVFLSNSLSYFSNISPEILANSFIRNAEVNISNGVMTHRLKEYSVPTGNGYTIFYYSNDSSNLSTAFLGEFNKNYLLHININGKEYNASTMIPSLAKKIDSLWWEKVPANPDTTKVVLMARSSDPPGYGNYIRYFTSTNGKPFFPALNSVFDDQIIDGKSYSVQVEKGVNRNEEIDFENYSFFNRGDTVTVRLSNIDKATFDFWRTMEYSYASIGNPFSSPTKVLGNISGGALGYFGGYGSQYTSFIIPK